MGVKVMNEVVRRTATDATPFPTPCPNPHPSFMISASSSPSSTFTLSCASALANDETRPSFLDLNQLFRRSPCPTSPPPRPDAVRLRIRDHPASAASSGSGGRGRLGGRGGGKAGGARVEGAVGRRDEEGFGGCLGTAGGREDLKEDEIC